MSTNVAITILVAFIFVGSTSCYNEGNEKDNFKIYFKKAYQLRLKDDSKNVTSKPQRIFRRSIVGDPTQILEGAFDRYQKASKLEKFERVSRNGTTDEKLDLVAEEVWDRTGADLVEKSFKIIGAKVGSQIGGYIGGK